ncbi:MAG: AAA family ATPase [Dehalococcoidales bacterium]|nr:AAA family ATPase [Dehalococcoidales bacterium]
MIDKQAASDARRLEASLGQLPQPVAKPAFVIVSGLPGTGKSFFSNRLVERVQLLILESDTLRRVLFTLPTYSAEESARLFRAIHGLIEELLKKGIPLVLDATNLSEANREIMYNIADRVGASLVIVRVSAPQAVVRERLRVRAEARTPENHSDADWATYQMLKPSVEKIQRQHFAVNTSRDINPVLDKIVREIKR